MSDLQRKAVTILEAAAARIDATGWTRGEDGPAAGPNCMRGALIWEMTDTQHSVLAESALIGSIRMAFAFNPAGQMAWKALQYHFGIEHPGNGQSVVGWNDRHCRSAADAADMLRGAAKRLAGEDAR